jgi:hypothetical protein
METGETTMTNDERDFVREYVQQAMSALEDGSEFHGSGILITAAYNVLISALTAFPHLEEELVEVMAKRLVADWRDAKQKLLTLTETQGSA